MNTTRPSTGPRSWPSELADVTIVDWIQGGTLSRVIDLLFDELAMGLNITPHNRHLCPCHWL